MKDGPFPHWEPFALVANRQQVGSWMITSMDLRARRGLEGEIKARRYIEGLGYRVIAARWRCRFGEIDLIARDGDTIVFVEVRSRSNRNTGLPEETIRALKRHRLTRLASAWLAVSQTGLQTACRFDVIGIRPRERGSGPSGSDAKPEMEIVHIKDAFPA